ncbi:MAG: HAMP domain-containing protein [Desulfobacteraceae bacterium]|nr:HAMP domain-containing protein [Desulfobacteraceae bacterium]
MKKKKRLIFQLYPSYLLLTLIALFAVSWHASSALTTFFLERTKSGLEIQAKLLQVQTKQLIAPADPVAMDRMCKTVAAGTPTRLTIILASGRVIGDSLENPAQMDNHRNRPEIEQALAGSISSTIRFSDTIGERLMYLALPLENNGRIEGVLRTSIALTAIDREQEKIRFRISIAGLLIALLASGVCFFISRRISKPIEEMKNSAAKFAAGDLDHRLVSPDTLEIAGLAEAMNHMAAQLQHRMEDLKRQRSEMEAVLGSMMEGVIAIDLSENIINMNRAASDIFQKSADHVQGKNVQELLRNREFYHMVRQSIIDGRNAETDITIRQQTEKILNTRIAQLFDAVGHRKGILVVANDVTQLRRLENIRSDFVANVSHEIKTPLTAIKGFVETLMVSGIDDPDQSKRFLFIVQKHVDRLSAIIEDLLSLARIEQNEGSVDLRMEEITVRNIIDTAIQVVQTNAENKEITFDVRCDDELTACWEATLIEQAVVNLMDNAVKYSPEKSRVHIHALKKGEEVFLSVKDDGPGIHKKHLERLFERFYRADKARSRKLGGTGLGLAIVKHIAKSHGGRVEVESTVGEGSVFVIVLPS